MHHRPHRLERLPQLAQALLAALGARGEDGFDLHAAFERRGQRVEHREIVAAEKREDETFAGAADHLQHRLPPCGGLDEDAVATGPVSCVWAATRRHS